MEVFDEVLRVVEVFCEVPSGVWVVSSPFRTVVKLPFYNLAVDDFFDFVLRFVINFNWWRWRLLLTG